MSEVVDRGELENVDVQYADETNGKSPQAQLMLWFVVNLLDGGPAAQQLFVGESTRLA